MAVLARTFILTFCSLYRTTNEVTSVPVRSPLVHVTVMGQFPRGVLEFTFHIQRTPPCLSADFETSP